MKLGRILREVEESKTIADTSKEVQIQPELAPKTTEEKAVELSKLLTSKQEIEVALELYREMSFEEKVLLFEEKLLAINSAIAKLNSNNEKALNSSVEMYVERAGLLEHDGKQDKKEVEVKALAEINVKGIKEVKKVELTAERISYWLDVFDSESSLAESSLITKLLSLNKMENNPINVTLQLNEILKAEYEGYIANTSDIIASNHEYKVTQWN